MSIVIIKFLLQVANDIKVSGISFWWILDILLLPDLWNYNNSTPDLTLVSDLQ